MLKKLIHNVLNFFFPQKCIGCGKENAILCDDCLARIDYPTLLNKNNVWAATDYNDVLAQKAIWLLKYRGLKQMAKPLAELIRQRLLPKVRPFSAKVGPLFIPIPVSPKRLKQRGFNQSELIARHLISRSDLNGQRSDLYTNVLYKNRETDSQVSLKDRQKRLDNLIDSFGVRNAESIINKNIILIDDVSTTGATIKEAKKVLLEAGARSVTALVVARG